MGISYSSSVLYRINNSEKTSKEINYIMQNNVNYLNLKKIIIGKV